MNKTRVIVMILVIVACLLLSGCAKTWYVAFRDESDLAEMSLTSMIGPGNFYDISSEGLVLDGYSAMASYQFIGDCTMTIVFELHCDIEDQWSEINLYFTDKENLADLETLGMTLEKLGAYSGEVYSIRDNSIGLIHLTAPIPGLNRDGNNTYKLIKTSNSFTVMLNSATIYSGAFNNYSQDYVVPYLLAFDFEDEEAEVYFKSIKVQYEGEMLPF